MTLRKITIDNSVRYVKNSEETRESKPKVIKNKKQSEQIQSISGGGKTNMRMNISVSRKQNKNISQNNKKFIKNVAASGFKYITK